MRYVIQTTGNFPIVEGDAAFIQYILQDLDSVTSIHIIHEDKSVLHIRRVDE